jgi:DNA-binding NarL/FixJ family response regulator
VAAKVLLVVAHPVIASGIETLLRLDGEYEVKRVVSVAEAMKQREWGAQLALIDGTLLAGYAEARIGAPSLVLTGNERDGAQLVRKLDDGRGWLRKDATGAELSKAIRAAVVGSTTRGGGLGTLAVVAIAVASAIALALVAYLVYLALY